MEKQDDFHSWWQTEISYFHLSTLIEHQFTSVKNFYAHVSFNKLINQNKLKFQKRL